LGGGIRHCHITATQAEVKKFLLCVRTIVLMLFTEINAAAAALSLAIFRLLALKNI